MASEATGETRRAGIRVGTGCGLGYGAARSREDEQLCESPVVSVPGVSGSQPGPRYRRADAD